MGDWTIFTNELIEQFPLILSGLYKTIELTITVSITGFLFGVVIFYLSINQYKIIRTIAKGYISFFIGTPLIILLFLMYYGLPQQGVTLSTYSVAVIGFTLNVGAYNAAYLTSAYNGLDFIELEAAKTQGFSAFQIFRLITLPQVLSAASIPSLTNQVINNLKDSSIAFLIEFTDFFARVQELASTNFQFFKAYLFAATIYLLLVSIIVIIAKLLEKKFSIPVDQMHEPIHQKSNKNF